MAQHFLHDADLQRVANENLAEINKFVELQGTLEPKKNSTVGNLRTKITTWWDKTVNNDENAGKRAAAAKQQAKQQANERFLKQVQAIDYA